MNAKILKLEQSQDLQSRWNTIKSDKVAIPSKEGFDIIDLNKVVFFESKGNYTQIVLADGQKKMASKTLKHFENRIQHYAFVRSHHSFFININFVEGLGSGSTIINGMTIPISRSKKQIIREALESHILFI